MKCTNRPEKWVLLGTLLVSFAVRGEGTLPIPVSREELPLTLNGAVYEASGTNRNFMEVSVDQANGSGGGGLQARCRSNESYYPAGGRVMVGSDAFSIKGICAAGSSPSGQRRIIATSDGELLQLDGNLAGSPGTQFNGTMKRESRFAPSPEAGGAPKSFNFELTRSGF